MTSFHLSKAEKSTLASLACTSIEAALAGENKPCPLEAPQAPPLLQRELGAFVTLTRKEHLRGCIGSIVGREPLFENVWRMARAAALEDPRFPPLQREEWADTDVEITVLDQLSPCTDPQAIEIGRHGLVLTCGGRSGVFLPQVPVEQGWDRQAYLENLCRKAGLPSGTWQKPDARLFWYEAEAFPAKH